MARTTSSVEGVFTDFPTSIIPKIGRESTWEGLIKIHWLISGNSAYVASNLGGGRYRHLALTITAAEYVEQAGFAFVPLHNPGNYPQSMDSSQEQALATEKFRQNQVPLRKYTAVDWALKNHIVTAVEPVFISPLVDQLTGFGHVPALTMLQHQFFSHRAINKIGLEENAVKMMEPYNPA